jgi:acyl-CoA thioesterase FadM
VNYGGHLGNDKLLLYAHEARVQVLQTVGFTELDCGGHGLIMADAEIVFKAEAFWGEVLEITLFAGGATGSSFSMYYLFEKQVAGEKKIVAQARTGIVAFDYTSRKVVPLSKKFKGALKL